MNSLLEARLPYSWTVRTTGAGAGRRRSTAPAPVADASKRRTRKGYCIRAESTGREPMSSPLSTPKPNASQGQRGKQCLDQKLVSKAAVWTFDEAILHGQSRPDAMPCDAAPISPCQDAIARALAADHLRIYTHYRSLIPNSSERTSDQFRALTFGPASPAATPS